MELYTMKINECAAGVKIHHNGQIEDGKIIYDTHNKIVHLVSSDGNSIGVSRAKIEGIMKVFECQE
jgi:hypothetical protein